MILIRPAYKRGVHAPATKRSRFMLIAFTVRIPRMDNKGS